MSLSIHLLANDGEVPLATVAAEEGQTILDALLRAGEAFSYSCQAGSCGSCNVGDRSLRTRGVGEPWDGERDDAACVERSGG